MNLFFDSMGFFDSSIKAGIINRLASIYGDMVCGSTITNAHEVVKLANIIKECDRVFIWNGTEIGCFWVIEICKVFKIPFCIIERGLFPQEQDNYMVDMEGICCRSKTLVPDNFNLKTLEINIKTVSNHYQNSGLAYVGGSQKIVFVMQLDWDSTVYHYSKFRTNEEFIDSVVATNNLNHDDVVVCPHPRVPDVTTKYRVSTNPTVEEAQTASQVIGLTSTVLFETLGMGCPTTVFGGHKSMVDGLVHPINRGWKDVRHLFSTILDNQISLSHDSDDSIRKKIEFNLN